jgi:hypothetical protein
MSTTGIGIGIGIGIENGSIHWDDFSEVFLGAKNEDALAEILSFLDVRDLGRASLTCQKLDRIIMREDPSDVVWEGAERDLTCCCQESRLKSILTAKEHCRMFAKAAKFALQCETSEEIPFEELGVDGLAVDLMNIRGMGREKVEALVEASQRNEEQEEQEDEEMATCRIRRLTPAEAEERTAHRKAQWEEILKEEVPEKECEYAIFVRVTRTETDELMGQGFSNFGPITGWHAPMESQKLLLMLKSSVFNLATSPEFKTLLENVEAEESADNHMPHFDSAEDYARLVRFTVLAVHAKNSEIRLISCTGGYDQDPRPVVSWSSTSYLHGGLLHEVSTTSKWDNKILELGSPFERHSISSQVGLMHWFAEDNSTAWACPILTLRFQKDNRAMFEFFRQQFQLDHPGARMLTETNSGRGFEGEHEETVQDS